MDNNNHQQMNDPPPVPLPPPPPTQNSYYYDEDPSTKRFKAANGQYDASASSSTYFNQPTTLPPQPPVESKKDRHMRVMLERLAKIEHDFAESKRSLYESQLQTLKKELLEIQNGTHPEFRDRVYLLEREREGMIEKARLWRDYQLQCAEAVYKQELEEAEQEYVGDRDGLRDRMLQQIEERKKKVKEERENMVIDVDATVDVSSSRMPTSRKLRRRPETNTASAMDSRPGRKRQPQGPQVSHTLKESEIMEDLLILSKLSNNRKGGLPKRGNRNR